jgi:DNA-binding transcriptional LysR family regulator
MSQIANGVDLRSLRALVAIADCGSFRAAAAQLGYSQSAISHRIETLERTLAETLFTRPGGRGAVSLTPAGQLAYGHARRALAAVAALEADAGSRSPHDQPKLRVGVFQTAAAELLPPALRALRRQWAGLEVILTEIDAPDELRDQLARGTLDLAFARNAASDERVEAIPLMEDRIVILTRRDSRLMALQRPTFEALDGADVVAWTGRWRIQLELEDAWRRRGIAPRVVYRTDDNLALQRLVAAGLGDACIGRLAARHAIDPALAWIAPDEELMPLRAVLLVPRHREPLGPAHTLIEATSAHFGG